MSKELLWGKGTTEGIVAVEPMPSQQNIAQVLRRIDGEVISEVHPYKPFIFVDSQDQNLKEFNDYRALNLFGSNPLNLLIEDNNYRLLRAINNKCKSYLPFLQSQWMLRTGETLFKGMEFDDPLRLYVDIEVYTAPEYSFPNSSRPEDKVIMISLLTNDGREKVMVLNEDGHSPEMDFVSLYSSESQLLESFVRGVRQLDPDILVFHNGFGFDLPYLRDRMQLHDVKFGIGRNGSEPYTFSTAIKFAEKSDQYENFSIYGRHIIDTYFLAKQFDIVARTLSGYGLKDCAKYLGIASEERTYIEGNEIASVWDNTHPKWTREDLTNYALDDVKETKGLDSAWGQSIFHQTKMIPLPLQDIARYGTGNKIDLLFTRHYLQNLWSWPLPDPKRKFGGGYANTFRYGHISEPLVYCDVGSLYPTLRKLLDIQPKKDELRLFQQMMDLIAAEREVFKYDKEHGETEEIRKTAKAADGSVKILSNTGSYGWLSWEYGAFNDYDEAERITTWGQKVVKRMNYEAENIGSKVIRCDSVTEDTPIYIKENGLIDIISIGELHSRGFGGSTTLRKHKGFENIQVLTRGGWSRIKYTKKHKTNKTIYRVLTRNGYAKVTEDHSLFQNGKEIKPKDLSIGDNIDELAFEDFGSQDVKLTKDQAWLLGFMVSDGSTSVSLHKADTEKLLKAKDIFATWGIKMKFYDTMKSSGCNKIIGGYNRKHYEFVTNMIYDRYTGEKKVPQCILNAPHPIIYNFLQGQMDGDGHVINRPATKSYILAAGLQYLCCKVNWYKTSIVAIRPDKPNIVSTNFSNPSKTQRNKNGIVRNIDTIEYDKEVYDISTDDGTFIGGTGNVIFHNTDGSLITVPEEYRSEEGELEFIKQIETNLNKWLETQL